MTVFLKILASVVLYVIRNLPRAELARIARSALALLSGQVMGLTLNPIAHEAEKVAFGELDAILAKIAGASK